MARTSAGVTGRSLGTAPISSDSPTTRPPWMPPRGENRGPASGPVIATAGRVDLGRAPELAHGHDQCILQHPAVLQILQQRGETVVEHGTDQIGVAADGAEGGRSMDVPRDLVEDGLEHVDRDEPNAPFHQPPGQQAALPELVAAVTVSNSIVFQGDVERLPGTRGTRSAYKPDGNWNPAAGRHHCSRIYQPPRPRSLSGYGAGSDDLRRCSREAEGPAP